MSLLINPRREFLEMGRNVSERQNSFCAVTLSKTSSYLCWEDFTDNGTSKDIPFLQEQILTLLILNINS